MKKYKFYNKLKNLIIISSFLILISLFTFFIYNINTVKNNIFDQKDINVNEVPYISTYYIEPIVAPNQNVKIDFYVTDYDHKEYISEDYSDIYTITVKIAGKKDIIKKNIKAGDNSINIGKFTNLGEQKFSIIATDRYGRNSHELFNYFLVQDNKMYKEYMMTNNDLIKYNIKNTDNYEIKNIVSLNLESPTKEIVSNELKKVSKSITPNSNSYICIIPDTLGNGEPGTWWSENLVKYSDDYDKTAVLNESTNTRIGLQKLLDTKKSEGYNKIKLLPGTYRIDHLEPIYIPSEFTLDLNNSIIKLNQFTGDKALMIDLNNTFDSHVVNGTIEGDYYSHDYKNSPNSSEWVTGISINGESKYSSFENLIVKDITGYGGSNGIGKSRDESLDYTYSYPINVGDTFKLGDINRTNGKFIASNNRTTSDFIDITDYNDIGYLSVNRYLGYQGNSCDTWNIICSFYDSNKKFIKSIDSYQYRRVSVPNNSKYIRITILGTDFPKDLSVQYFRIPTHCTFKNIKFKNCRAIALAQFAMKDMLVEDCEFSKSGQTLANCAYDAEDGWDLMQDVTFRGLSFYNNPNNDFLTCAGHNFIIEDIKNGKISAWERTNSLVVRNNNNIEITLNGGNIENRAEQGVYRIYGNNFISGTVANNLAKNNTSKKYLSGKIYNSTITQIADNSYYKNCTIKVSSEKLGYLSKVTMINCNFEPVNGFHIRYVFQFNGGHLSDYYFENCNFKGKSLLANNNGFYSGSFINCIFEDVNIQPNVEANKDDLILFKHCTMNYGDNSLIYYSPFAYSKGTYSQLEFNNCIITNTSKNKSSLIYAYASPNGLLNFINSKINLNDNITFFDGTPSNDNYISTFEINLNNSLNSNIKLKSDFFKDNTTIKINP